MLKKIIKKKNIVKKIILDENIISALGIANIPVAKQKKIVKKLEDNVQRKIVLAVLQNLNEKEREAFDSVLKLKDNKITNAFINSTIPDAKEFIENIAVSIIEEFKKLSTVK